MTACDGTLRANALSGSSTPRAVYHHRSVVLKRIDSSVVGLRHRRPASFGDAPLELAIVGGCGQQRPKDLKAQTCPSHPRTRRVVVVGHGSPGGGRDRRTSTTQATPMGKTPAAPTSARTAPSGAVTLCCVQIATRPGRSWWVPARPKGLAMAAGPTPSRSKSELRIRPGSGAGARRAERATNGLVLLNGPRHHRSHHRPRRHACLANGPAHGVAARATALARTITAPTYTRRPRNRTDCVRRPSQSHKTAHCSPANSDQLTR